MNKLAAFWA